jgi:hypothetical protein
MKKYLLIIITILLVHSVEAQFFQLGLKGGVSASKAQVDEHFSAKNGNFTYHNGDATLGWHLGLYSRIKIASFFIQPEVLFSSTGGKIEISKEGIQTPEIAEIDLNKLDVPIMVGFYLGESFRIFAGPTFSYLISEDINGLELYPDLKQNYDDATIGYQAGFGVDISRFMLEFKYEGNLSTLGESVTIPATHETFNTDLRNPQFIASIGIRLF